MKSLQINSPSVLFIKMYGVKGKVHMACYRGQISMKSYSLNDHFEQLIYASLTKLIGPTWNTINVNQFLLRNIFWIFGKGWVVSRYQAAIGQVNRKPNRRESRQSTTDSTPRTVEE